jgi:response regulator RpfG family c-di-GMP phosphodiesterase
VNDRSVLFVDDEEHILSSLKRLLRKEPYRFLSATGGEEGLRVLAENPDVQMVVTDQRMPGMCGTEFLARVRALYPDTVRIVLSGFAEASAIVDAINQGEVYRFIGKPWDDENLKATFRQCLQHYDIMLENRRLNEQSARQLEQLENLNHLLESSVEERTRSLSFSQEVLDTLPVAVLGISQEEEIMLTNGTARARIQDLRNLIPGTRMEEVLPPEAVDAIRGCLLAPHGEVFEFDWGQNKLKARSQQLGSKDAPRGCVILLEGV